MKSGRPSNTVQPQESQDWSCRKVRAALLEAGWTLVQVSRAFKLHEAAARHGARGRNRAGERAIAAVLKLPLHQIWPSRWTEVGAAAARRQRRATSHQPTRPRLRQQAAQICAGTGGAA